MKGTFSLIKEWTWTDQLVAGTSSTYVSNLSPMEIAIRWSTLGDVGGQKTLRSYWRNYFEKTDALIWVVDATDRLRVDDCREELHGLLQEEVSCEISISPTILRWSTAAFWSKLTRICEQNRREWLYGRGWDSRGTWPRWRVVEEKQRSANPLQGLQLNAIKTHKWHIIRCSAITGTNLQEGLAWVVQDAKSRLFLY
jgi:hypothetical protein